MEDEDKLEMGIFGDSNIELNGNFNFDIPSDDSDLEDNEDTDIDPNKNIATVEDDSSEEVDGEEDDQDEGRDEDGNSSSNLYSSLAAFVHEQGFLPSLDIENTKIETPDDFANAFKQELEIQAQSKLEEYIANIDVSKIAQSKKVIEDYSQITEDVLKEDISLAKDIIKQDYINQGFDDKKTARYLKRLIDLGDEALIEEALESNQSIQEFESRRIESEKKSYAERLEQEKIEQAKLDEALKATIYERKDLVNGLPVTKALQDKVYKTINEIVGKSPDGYFENRFMKERRENQLEFDTRMYYFYELTNGFKDYSKLTTSAKSSAVKDLERIARKTKIQDNGTPLWMQDGDSYDGKDFVLNI